MCIKHNGKKLEQIVYNILEEEMSNRLSIANRISMALGETLNIICCGEHIVANIVRKTASE